MQICPLSKQPCENEETCPLRIKLEDFEGCPFDLADKAIQYLKTNTILPAARKLDGLVQKYLKPTDPKDK